MRQLIERSIFDIDETYEDPIEFADGLSGYEPKSLLYVLQFLIDSMDYSCKTQTFIDSKRALLLSLALKKDYKIYANDTEDAQTGLIKSLFKDNESLSWLDNFEILQAASRERFKNSSLIFADLGKKTFDAENTIRFSEAALNDEGLIILSCFCDQDFPYTTKLIFDLIKEKDLQVVCNFNGYIVLCRKEKITFYKRLVVQYLPYIMSQKGYSTIISNPNCDDIINISFEESETPIVKLIKRNFKEEILEPKEKLSIGSDFSAGEEDIIWF